MGSDGFGEFEANCPRLLQCIPKGPKPYLGKWPSPANPWTSDQPSGCRHGPHRPTASCLASNVRHQRVVTAIQIKTSDLQWIHCASKPPGCLFFSCCVFGSRTKNSGWYGQEEWTSTGIQTAKHTIENNITSTYAESKNGFKTLLVHNTINLCLIQILIGGVNKRDYLNQTWILLFTEKCWES